MTDRPTPWTDDLRLMNPTGNARRSFGDAYERLVGVMARLRAEDGCPWDRAQDLDSLRAYLIEETYEVVEALEEGTPDDHLEELGDLLMQVVFHAELRREAGTFDAADVAHGICDKLVRRHPHVFAEDEAMDPDEALRHWEAQKAKEKLRKSAIDGVPRRLPALLRAQRITEKASRVGFDWPDAQGPLAKIKEELGELEEVMGKGDASRVADELGDLLFSVVNLARFCDSTAEDALTGATNKFSARFKEVERLAKADGKVMSEMSIEALEALWTRAKETQRS